jgi:hypothetical protein
LVNYVFIVSFSAMNQQETAKSGEGRK